jgi:HEAT repeat protein
MLDKAFEALKSYDYGKDRSPLTPIDDAAAKAKNDAAACKELESQLLAALKGDLKHDGKDYICRKLMLVGGPACVGVLAALLTDKDMAHMARYALERIQAPEAGAALRDALAKTSGPQKIGVITSLGARRDEASVAAISTLVGDGDAAIARAAALALGAIRSPQAATALAKAKPEAAAGKAAATDATLACAEALLKSGNKGEAMAIYKGLMGESAAPKHIKLAATRGMLACTGAGKKD